MMGAANQAGKNGRAGMYFGILLCILLAFFALERKAAAYPTHNVAATTLVGTGIQKPTVIALEDSQNLKVPVDFLSVLASLAASPDKSTWSAIQWETPRRSFEPVSTPLSVRPPPTL